MRTHEEIGEHSDAQREDRGSVSAARVPRLETILSLQRTAGNRHVRRLLRDPIDTQVPTGVTAAAVAVPAGANIASPDTSTVVADPSLPGGWTEANGTTTSSGRVGAVDRILLEGITGSQGPQGAIPNVSGGTGPGFAGTVGTGAAGSRGRAVALVPRAVRTGATGEIAVVVHFHGIKSGAWDLRSRGARPEDVAPYQIPQQVEAFLGARPGARLIVLLPLGVSTESNVFFGLTNVDTFVTDCFNALGRAGLPQGSSAGPVYLSAHSGGGLYISQLLANPARLPRRFAGLFGFESWHGDAGTWENYITGRMNADLAELERMQTALSRAGQNADQIATAQVAYLRDSGFRFVGFGGLGGYATRVRHIREVIINWFGSAAVRTRLANATGSRAEVLNQLWANYQANYFAGSTHSNALSKDNNFGRALASLPSVGALASTPSATPPPASGTPGTGTSTPPPMISPPPPATTGGDAGARTSVDDEHPAADPEPRELLPAARASSESSPLAPLEIPVVAATTNGATPATVATPTATATPAAFTRQHYAMSDREVVVVRAGAGRREIRKRASDLTAEVLRLAGQDPVAWYNDFTAGVTFLGRTVTDPIHVRLAEHLRRVEGTLAAQYGGPTNDPAVAGRTLGLTENIIGSRPYPTSASVSMHMFGLALDVNYTANPFISGSANPVFARAGQLMNGRPGAWSSGMTYAQLSALNTTLTSYFALLADAAALQTRLAAATGAPWQGRTVDQARAQIQADLTDVSGRWERGSGAGLAAVRSTGFTNLSQNLVNGIGLSWGAAYGDMMHFDMRGDGGLGQRIRGAIDTWKAAREAEASRPAAPAAAVPVP